MAFQISRLYDFQPGTKILSSQVDAELNQLVTKHNALDAATDLYKTTLASNTGASSIGITPPTGLDTSITTLSGFIVAEVSARLSHTSNVSNPHGVTASQVGLGNLTNYEQAKKTEFNAHTSNMGNPHSVTKAQVGLGNVNNTSDTDKPVSTSQRAALDLKVDKVTGKSLILDTDITKLDGIQAGAEVNVQTDWLQADNTKDDFLKNKPTLGTASSKNVGTSSGQIPILNSGGKLEISVLPALAISETSVVASQSAMIALTAQQGDIAIRTDVNKSFILTSNTPTNVNDWQELLTPTDLVLSVCGKVGAVNLTADDVGALEPSDIVNLLTSTSTDKVLSAAQGKVLKDLIGSLTSLNGFFVGSPSCIIDALNSIGNKIGMVDFNAYYGSITSLIGALNKLATDKVTSSSITSVKAESGKMYFSTDGSTWVDCTGPQGIQGKGYNPRGSWVSGGSYINNSTTIDVVESNGSTYYCKVSNSSNTPPESDTTNWGLMALSGTAALGSQIPLTGYSVSGQFSSVSATDSVNQAISKLEAGVVALNTFKTSSIDPLIVLSDQLIRQGFIIDLPQVTDIPSPTNLNKTYSFSTPNLQLTTGNLGSNLSFLDKAYIELDIYPSMDTSGNRSSLFSINPSVSSIQLIDSVVSGNVYSLSGSFNIVWTNPVSIEVVIKPRLIIPGILGTMTSFS